jgi:secondary thiamine-phosphate synthase enzyme
VPRAVVFQNRLTIRTGGRGTTHVTDTIQACVRDSGVRTGLCHLFLHHTSASLVLCENADPDVRTDLERYMARLVPDGDALFEHTAEGPDDMPAHIRNIMTGSDLTLPVAAGQCDLGTWQGVYLWEHRTAGHRRTLTVTVYGE